MAASVPSSRAARLLLAEGAALLPVLRAAPEPDLDRPTVLPGWSVRDVLAHCSAALHRAATGTLHAFTSEDNAADVEERRPWPVADLLTELESGYVGAAAAMDAAEGRLDGLALGEWVHGGDVREALGIPGAWASAGLEDALTLLIDRTVARGVPRTLVTLTGPGPARELVLGTVQDDRVPARMRTDAATLIRLCAGRGADLTRVELIGATPEEYLVFG